MRVKRVISNMQAKNLVTAVQCKQNDAYCLTVNSILYYNFNLHGMPVSLSGKEILRQITFLRRLSPFFDCSNVKRTSTHIPQPKGTSDDKLQNLLL